MIQGEEENNIGKIQVTLKMDEAWYPIKGQWG